MPKKTTDESAGETDGGTNLAKFLDRVGAGDDDDPDATVVLQLQLHLQNIRARTEALRIRNTLARPSDQGFRQNSYIVASCAQYSDRVRDGVYTSSRRI